MTQRLGVVYLKLLDFDHRLPIDAGHRQLSQVAGVALAGQFQQVQVRLFLHRDAGLFLVVKR